MKQRSNWPVKLLQLLRILLRASVLCLIGLIIVTVGWIGIRPEDFPAAHLEPSPESLVIGQTSMQSDLRIPITVHNRSSRPIHIRHFELSHSSLRILPASLTIPAGTTVMLDLQLDVLGLLFNGGVPAENDEPQPFEVHIRPVTNFGRVPLPWRIHGMARSVPVDRRQS